ncbi:MAG: LysR family transcriptional regulator [Rhodobacteraceae bacterium]|nr:LysR family transcriptional regulator [Paracoccaceae bacterium]
MLDRDVFKGLAEFLAVARSKSFRKAADGLGVSAVAVGATIRHLEERLEAKLFHRTTRRVELTPAGFLLLERIGPLAGTLTETLQAIHDQAAELGGTLRICVQTLALDPVLDPALIIFAERYPGVTVDVEIREGRTDLLANGFDLGIRLGEYIEDDMVAMRIPLPVHWRIVGSRSYLDRFGRPEVPKDVMAHRCIRRRWPGQDQHYRWEFSVNHRIVLVDPPGRLTVSSFATAMRLVAAGNGLCYLTREMFSDLARHADVEEVLTGYMPPPNFLYTYFSPASRENRRIRAFVDCIRELRSP